MGLARPKGFSLLLLELPQLQGQFRYKKWYFSSDELLNFMTWAEHCMGTSRQPCPFKLSCRGWDEF